MFECFKIRRMSPCFRLKKRASGALRKQSRERLGDGQNDDQDEQNKMDSQIMSVRWMTMKTSVDDDDCGRVSEGEQLEFGSSSVASFGDTAPAGAANPFARRDSHVPEF